MNGGFPRAYFSPGAPPLAAHPGVRWGRLGAALAASCLVHAVLVVLPYFGTSSAAAPRSVQKAAPVVRTLDLRLEQAGSAEPRRVPGRTRGTNQLPIPAPGYSRADELTQPPRPASEPKLDVPRSVARAVSGEVVLKLWINELGIVESVEVEASSLPGTVSGMVAQAFREQHFVPGEIDGRRVRSLMRIEVTYVRGKPPR